MFYKRDWFIFFVITALIFLAAARTGLDTDLWWHLRAGEETISQGFPLMEDHFSFTRMGTAWTNHSWLSQVIFYLTYRTAGFVGVGILAALAATISMALIYFQMSGKPIIRAFLLVLGMLVSAVVWSPRPQVFSLVLFSVTSLILYVYKWRQKNYLGWLLIIFVLWSNLHGGYPLGLILIGVTVAGEMVNRLIHPNLTKEMTWREIGFLALIGIIGGLVVVINPNGLKMWTIPFETVEVTALQQLIQEWASPDFHELFQQPFLWLLFSTLAAIAFSDRKADAVDVLLVIVFGYLGLTSRRNFGPFALVATPVLSRYIWLAWKGLKTNDRTDSDWISDLTPGRFISNWQKVINLILVGVLFFAAFIKVYLVNHPVFITQTIQTTLPAGAAVWVKENKPEGNMLNEYNWGGYLSWELRDFPIFIDGRTDLYGDCGINEWIQLIRAGEFWHEILDGYKIGFIVVDPQQPIVNVLIENGWTQTYKDAISIVLVRSMVP